MRSSVCIIANPEARGSSPGKVEHAAGLFRQKGFDVSVLLTGRRGDAELMAVECAGKKTPLVAAAGGDGTINEVMNGLAGTDVPLAVIPLGTTNVLAKELNIPEDTAGAVDVAVGGTARPISLGRISYQGGERYFCLMAGMGFDADAVHGMNASVKKLSGKLAYVLSGVMTLLRYDPSELVLRVDGLEHRGHAAIIGKAAKYGGNFSVTPDANLADPHLYACIFRGRRRRDLLRYVSGVVRGAHLSFDDVVYARAEAIEVEGDAHIQIDGDYLGRTPARITVVRDAVRLIY